MALDIGPRTVGWVHPVGDVPVAADDVLQLHAKSMPRSGHHLLVDMLAEYLGDAFAYCSFYGQGPWCCAERPCTRQRFPSRGNRIHMQKSHDGRFEDPVMPSGIHVIQHRNFVPRLQSHYDHWIAANADRADTMDAFRKFSRAQVRYTIRFWRKWLTNPPMNALVIRYEDLTHDPASTLTAMLRVIDTKPIDVARVHKAVAVVAFPSTSSLQKTGRFVPRDVRAHRHFDQTFLLAMEALVLAHTPGNRRHWPSRADQVAGILNTRMRRIHARR